MTQSPKIAQNKNQQFYGYSEFVYAFSKKNMDFSSLFFSLQKEEITHHLANSVRTKTQQLR